MDKRTPAKLSKHKEKVYDAIFAGGNPAIGAEEICKATRLPITAVRLPVRQLIAERRIKKHGRGVARATKYAVRAAR